MKALPRYAAWTLKSGDVPRTVGVYVFFRHGFPVYSGRAVGATGVHGRVWSFHLATTHDLSRSSFRRNVCEELGIADTGVTKQRPPVLTADDVEPVNRWIRECQVAWRLFDTGNRGGDVGAAKSFEVRLHREWLPPLSKR